jgi:hypothetical protein
MSKKRGLSLEEKRTRLLEVFFEKKEFFQLKELENIAPKLKGNLTSFPPAAHCKNVKEEGTEFGREANSTLRSFL